MNKSVLLIGGTRYFGKLLAEKLLASGTDLTILSRGSLPESLKTAKHCRGDRADSRLVENLFSENQFDVVYDQYCMNAQHAQLITKNLLRTNATYIMTSTVSVYDAGADISESHFDTAKYSYTTAVDEVTDYRAAKRQAEYEILNSGFKNFTLIRIPIVLGMTDYTLRLHKHIEHGLNSTPLYFPNLNARMSFVESNHLADVLYRLGEKGVVAGALNVASPDSISMRDLLNLIVKETEKPFKLTSAAEFEALNDQLKSKFQSPFGVSDDWFISTEKLKSLSIQLPVLADWLPKLIHDLTVKLSA